MRTGLLTIAALVCVSALTISAQQQAQTADTTQRAAAAAADQVITVTGCLKAEKDVPGRRPNAAGGTEDFVLTSVTMAPGSKVAGIGLAAMYEIQGIADAELQKHLNHQVEVTGTLTPGNAKGNRGTAPETNPGAERREGTPQSTANADLPEIQATSIKMLAATCPAP